MIFNSIQFMLFILITIVIYFLIPLKYRWGWLLLTSYYFYACGSLNYLFLMFFLTIATYLLALKLENEQQSKYLLIFGVGFNLIFLIFFKYFNFISESATELIRFFSIQSDPLLINFILPLGISFYIFQNISYLIDVYAKKIPAEKHLGLFAVYVSFFPKLISGPIERAGDFIPQLKTKNPLNYLNFVFGLKLIILGFFKKLVIADRLGFLVNTIYSSPTDYCGIPLILAVVFFPLQLYFDFSGYIDIARGSSKVLGIQLSKNFNRPLFARNPADFWKRWHITLSKWFEDYVFTPLYLFTSKIRFFSKLNFKNKHFLSFFLSLFIGEIFLGLWHGANWTFVLFGVYYAIFIFLYYLFRKKFDKLPILLKIISTICLVIGSFIFFRANSVSDAVYILLNLFNFESIQGVNFGLRPAEIFLGLFFAILFFFVEFLHEFKFKILNSKLFNSGIFKWFLYLALTLLILFFGIFKTSTNFIYQQF
ncbi:MAG: MBOAT family O-acyltransferase [Nanoarchaeota archaeon]|nr:MBOAT family O-acyltransferase [Nanoarchaeota archaeon]